MKKENGITLTSLVLYVVVMIIVIGVMSQILNNFYNNTDYLRGNVEEIVEFNKFNNYFLKEIKLYNNKIESATETYILFKSGNSFSVSNNIIYYNNIKICEGVQSVIFDIKQDEEDEEGEYTIVNVTLNFENFKKSINYKLENIY